MKKIYYIIFILFFVCIACEKKQNNDLMQNFAEIFARNAINNQIDSISFVYPDVKYADSIGLHFNPENLKISPLDQEGIYYRIKYSPETSIDVVRKNNGAINVVQSHGLFVFPDTLVTLAKNWGLWNNKLSDVEISRIIKEQVEPKLVFKSPDLDFFNLHGKVKSMVISYVGFDGKKYPWLGVWGWKGNYEFNEEGQWINPQDVSTNFKKIVRNEDNQICKIELQYDTMLGDYMEISYNWNDNRPVSYKYYSHEGYEGSFNYQEENNGDNIVLEGIKSNPHNPYDMDYEISESTQLSEFEFDDKGNWINCKCIYRYNEYIGGNANSGNKSGTMTREIIYY